MSTVSIDQTIRITPGVLGAGGDNVVLLGLFLTQSTRVPINTVQGFGGPDAVANLFGGSSIEAQAAAKYFAAGDLQTKKPATMYFAQYNQANVGAYLRSGSVKALSLTQLQAISGSLSIVIDGVTKSGSPNLSGATSFTNAAQIIAAALGISGPQSSAFTGVISGTTLTASSVTGPITPGGTLVGAGITAGTYIVSQLTGTTGGAGTYQVSASQSVSSESMTSNLPAVTYDSITGSFVVISPTTGASSTIAYATGSIAGSLNMTLTTGAVLSQGALAVSTPAAYMNALTQVSRAFATFQLVFNPDQSGSNDVRFAFAQWNATQGNAFIYNAIDSDASPTTSVPAPSCLAQRIAASQISGTIANWQSPTFDNTIDYADLVGFVAGYIASIDFTALNGRSTLSFKAQSGLTPSVTDDQTYDNLIANGYNFYTVEANGESQWIWYVNGSISGPFTWADTYLNQIAINRSFTDDLANLLQSAPAIPYNAAGRALIEGSLSDSIEQFLNFGAYRTGVVLSSSQAASVNASAGKNIADTITNQGWYLDVGVAAPSVRQSRGSPPMTFYYMDGESVQEFDMASIVLL